MKNKIFAIVGLVVLLLHNISYSQDHEFSLVEDTSFALSSISSISLSPNGKLFTFCDRSSGNLYVYDYTNGSLHSKYMPTIGLSDSISLKGIYPKKNKKLAFIRELVGKDGKLAPDHVLKASLTNQFHISKFFNDSIIICLGQFFSMVMDVSTPDSMIRGRATFGGLVVVNINTQKIISCSPCEYGGVNTFVQTSTLLPVSQDSVILPVANYDAADLMGYDSAWTLAGYAISGKLGDYLYSFPQEGILNKLMYNSMESHICRDSSGQVLCTFQVLPFIYNITTLKKIHLDTLFNNNDQFLEKIRLLREKANSEIQWDSLREYKRMFLTSVEASATAYYITFANRLQLNPWKVKRSVRSYSIDGELIRAIEFSQFDVPDLQNLFYDALNGYVVQALKNSDGWRIKKIKWQ